MLAPARPSKAELRNRVNRGTAWIDQRTDSFWPHVDELRQLDMGATGRDILSILYGDFWDVAAKHPALNFQRHGFALGTEDDALGENYRALTVEWKKKIHELKLKRVCP
jgi:hypothetical protein